MSATQCSQRSATPCCGSGYRIMACYPVGSAWAAAAAISSGGSPWRPHLAGQPLPEPELIGLATRLLYWSTAPTKPARPRRVFPMPPPARRIAPAELAAEPRTATPRQDWVPLGRAVTRT